MYLGKTYIFDHEGVMSHTPHFKGGANKKGWGNGIEKKTEILWGTKILVWGPNDIFPRGGLNSGVCWNS